METIGAIMKSLNKEQAKQPSSLPVLSRKTELVKIYGKNEVEFIESTNPSYQPIVAQNVELCYFGEYPTLSEIAQVYGEYTPNAWLVAHLYDLSEFCGCKDKLTQRQMDQLSEILTTEYYYLNIAELMLFFNRFKIGRYGRFYGAVDPIVITTAIRDFSRERIAEMDMYEREHKKELDSLNNKIVKPVTREEYEQRKSSGEQFEKPKYIYMEEYVKAKFGTQWKKKMII